MIPRKETEFWVEQMIGEVKQEESKYVIRGLDLFSGSGNVGVALLKDLDEATMDFIEFDPKLKEQIDISILKNNIKKTRAHVLTGDIWEGAQGTYDLITVVPPYVPSAMREEVMQELHAEDPLSFFDKEDGYYYHKKVLERAKEFLKPNGTLYLEFDITQREQIEKLAQEYGFIQYHFLRDPYGHEYVIVL
jgi:HemK-like putative methylase